MENKNLKEINGKLYDFTDISKRIGKEPFQYNEKYIFVTVRDNGALLDFLIDWNGVPYINSLIAAGHDDALRELDWTTVDSAAKSATQPFSLTRPELLTLADIVWFMKGVVHAQGGVDNTTDFGQVHVDVLVKVIKGVRRQ